MRKFARPTVVISKCLEFEACRYNARMIPFGFVHRLAPYVKFLPVCPEVEIGLGVPRDPVRLLAVGGSLRLVQPSTGRDLTKKMAAFAGRFLSALPEVDGFLLKSRSPSCGLKDTKTYARTDAKAARGKGAGLFGGKVLEAFPGLAVEDEARLADLRVREHFLTKLFALAALRRAGKSGTVRALARFHAAHELLLMAYSQKERRVLERIAAHPEKAPAAEILSSYETHFRRALARPARRPSNLNALAHALGHFSQHLSPKEKAHFLDRLEKYRSGKVPLSAIRSLLRAWNLRFENEYLSGQAFFAPYPAELEEVADSGGERGSRG